MLALILIYTIIIWKPTCHSAITKSQRLLIRLLYELPSITFLIILRHTCLIKPKISFPLTVSTCIMIYTTKFCLAHLIQSPLLVQSICAYTYIDKDKFSYFPDIFPSYHVNFLILGLLQEVVAQDGQSISWYTAHE